MRTMSQLFLHWVASGKAGWDLAKKPILFIVIGSVLLTGIISAICFLIVRRKHQNADKNFPTKAENDMSPKGKKVKFCCLLLSGIVVLSSLAFVVMGVLPRSNINDISPATGARFKVASCFEIGETIKFYTTSTENLIQMGPSQLPDALSQEDALFFDCQGTVVPSMYAFSVSGLSKIRWSHDYHKSVFEDMADMKALNVEGQGIVNIRNRYIFICDDDPGYTMVLYDTDIGYIVAIYGYIWENGRPTLREKTWYFKYEDFVRYAQRDRELIKEVRNKLKEEGKVLYGGVGQGYEDPTGYNPLNVTLITEEKSWNNSHEAILYIIACAILHVALVCAIWYGGYRLYQKKRRSTPPADPNTEEAPKSDTE